MKGVIFDLDGTMIDNMMVHHEAWQKKLSENGLELTLDEVKEKIHGINQEIINRLFGDTFTPGEVKKFSYEKEKTYREIFKNELAPIPGLVQFIEELRDAHVPMGIATAAPTENVDFALDGLGIRHFFNVVLDAGHVTRGKPDPEIFLLAANKLGLDPVECVVFEDSPTGAQAGAAAGCQVRIITTTHQPNEFARFPQITHFYENYDEVDVTEIIS